MLLGEPEQTKADLNFVLFGFPVRVHPFFWLVAVLLGMNSSSPPDLLAWVVALFLSILVHELGHAAVMRAYGFQPWIALYGMGGLASYNPGQGYGARRQGPLAQVLISLAGPGAGFLLAALVVGAVKLSGHPIQLGLGGHYGITIALGEGIELTIFENFVLRVLFICIMWGMVNLLPVYPLDGGQIARELLLLANPRDGIRQSLWLSVFTAAALGVLGLVHFHSLWIALLFGYLAYMSYSALQAYGGRGRGW